MPPGRPSGSRNVKTSPKKKMDIRRRTKGRLPLGTYNFTRYASTSIGTGANSFTLSSVITQNSFNFTFLLTNLRNSSDFTNLFDQYRINYVDLFFKLVTNPDAQTSTTLSSSYFPTLWFVRDYDDAGPMTVADMQERQDVKRIVLRPDVINKIRVNPKFLAMSYQTLTSTGYSPRVGFIDCVDSAVPHYGLKTVFNVPTSGTNWDCEVYARYNCTFKGPQ